MPNECWNTVRIGADEKTIKYLVQSEFSFAKLCPQPENYPLDAQEWAWDNWGTKWDRQEYKVEDVGDQGLIIKFATPWSPPFTLFKYLIESNHNIWLKCDWSEEGGGAGVFVGFWNKEENKLETQELIWSDWCVEEWSNRMRNDNTQIFFEKPRSHCATDEEYNSKENRLAIKTTRGEYNAIEKIVKDECKENTLNEQDLRKEVIKRLADRMGQSYNI